MEQGQNVYILYRNNKLNIKVIGVFSSEKKAIVEMELQRKLAPNNGYIVKKWEVK